MSCNKWPLGCPDDFLGTCKNCLILKVFSVFTTFYLKEMLLDKHVLFLVDKLGFSFYEMFRTIDLAFQKDGSKHKEIFQASV